MSLKITLYLALCFFCSGVFSQEVVKSYNLDNCISIALENNLDLKATTLSANTAEINYKQSKANLLPALNGNYSIGVNNGRSIDPFTNDFINQELTFSSAGLNLNATVFNGFRLINSLKQQQLNKKASNFEIEENRQNLALNVTLAYLQVLNAKAILELAKKQTEVTNEQYKRQEDLFNEAVGNPADFADMKGQKTIDETSVLVAESAFKRAKLSLIQLLNLQADVDIKTEAILLAFEAYKLTSEDVYTDALANLATFKARETRVEASKKGVNIAKAQYTPEISFFGQVNTNYSSVAETFTETGTSVVNTGDFVTVNGQNLDVQTNASQFQGERISYRDQFDNNLNTVIGLSLQVPLFNGFRAKNNVALEKIKVEESLIALERTQQQIKNAIEQVYFDMQNAYKSHNSLLNQVEAFKESFRVNEIRFNNGASNFLAYVTSKNNLDRAKRNLTNAKYAYILRVKILEFYRGSVIK